MTGSSERTQFECELHGAVGYRNHCPICEIEFEQREAENDG